MPSCPQTGFIILAQGHDLGVGDAVVVGSGTAVVDSVVVGVVVVIDSGVVLGTVALVVSALFLVVLATTCSSVLVIGPKVVDVVSIGRLVDCDTVATGAGFVDTCVVITVGFGAGFDDAGDEVISPTNTRSFCPATQ